MGQLLFSQNLEVKDFNPEFLKNVIDFSASLQFDVFAWSGWRSVREQLEWVTLDRQHHGAVTCADPPSKSAHCCLNTRGEPDGRAVDLMPLPKGEEWMKLRDDAYMLMQSTCKQFKLINTGGEKFHLQDEQFSVG